jgi:hypothetical protein
MRISKKPDLEADLRETPVSIAFLRRAGSIASRIIVSTWLTAGIAAPIYAQSPGGLSAGGFSAESGSTSSGLAGLGGGAVSSGKAAVQVADPVFDFGTALNGETVKHVFKLKSTGTGPLIIGGVQTSCGCTAAHPTRSNVPPGEESEIAVSFDTHADKGPATRSISVFTNDPKHQQLKLTIKGDVKIQVEAAPAPVAFGTIKHGTEQSRRVLITDLVNDRDLKVGPITNSSPHIRVTQQPRSDGKPGAALIVTLLRTMPAGTFTDIVKVATSRAPVEITVFGNVVGDLSLTPPQVSFGIVPHHASALRIVRLTNSGERAVKVVSLSSTSQSVTAGAEAVKAGKEYKITLQLRPNTPDGALRGMLAIKTDDPEQQTVQLPFYGIVGSFKG